MAIFSKYLIASSILSAIALAAPLIQRDIVTDIVTETVWTTIDATTTIYDNTMPPAATTPAVMTSPTIQMNTIETPTSNPTTLVPMTTPVAPPPPSTQAAEFFGTSTTASLPSAVGATAATPTAAAPSTSAGTSASAAVASSTAVSGSINASTSGTCEGEGNACVGDVTHWDGGLGACGTNVDTNTDLAIALPYQFMGTASNDNPYCGRSVTLYNPTSGTTVQATVRDKCMGCLDRAIDCTDILFNEITDNMGNGRMSGIEWWLN
jgi:hypothetical protein